MARLSNQRHQRVGVDPEPAGFGDHRLDVALGETLATVVEQPRPGAGGHEHADAPALLHQPVVGQHVDALGRGGRVDPVEGGKLVGRRHPVALGERALGDLLGQALGDLGEDRGALIEHGPLPGNVGRCGCSLVHYLTNVPVR